MKDFNKQLEEFQKEIDKLAALIKERSKLEAIPKIFTIDLKCVCGAESVNSSKHSEWCDKYE